MELKLKINLDDFVIAAHDIERGMSINEYFEEVEKKVQITEKSIKIDKDGDLYITFEALDKSWEWGAPIKPKALLNFYKTWLPY